MTGPPSDTQNGRCLAWLSGGWGSGWHRASHEHTGAPGAVLAPPPPPRRMQVKLARAEPEEEEAGWPRAGTGQETAPLLFGVPRHSPPLDPWDRRACWLLLHPM